MGKLNNGILGTFTSKVANVVGFKWKNVNALRAYAKPANPRTMKQVGHRNRHKECMAAIKPIYNSTTKELMRGTSRTMSGINVLMQKSLLESVKKKTENVPYVTISKRNVDFKIKNRRESAYSGGIEIEVPTSQIKSSYNYIYVGVVNTKTGECFVGYTPSEQYAEVNYVMENTPTETGDIFYAFAYGSDVEVPEFNDQISTSTFIKWVATE